MTVRLLIDECLSPELVKMAIDAGYVESTCVRDRGWAGTKDWELIKHVVDGDYTLVTNNSVDFRGSGPGSLGGHHARQAIHAGLICLNAENGLDLQLQLDLFKIALEELAEQGDLVNKALEVSELANKDVQLTVYPIPD
jgi:hypothetical protein